MSYTISPRRLRIGLLLLTAGMILAYFMMGHAAKPFLAYLLLLSPGTLYAVVLAASIRPNGAPATQTIWRIGMFIPFLMAGSVLVIMSVLHGWLTPTIAGTIGVGILLLLVSVIFGLHARKLWMWMLPLVAGALSQYVPLAFGGHFAALPYVLILAWWWLVSEALLFITGQPVPGHGAHTETPQTSGPPTAPRTGA